MDTLSSQKPGERFSERELAVLRLMAEGLSNQEIADRLFLALTTVKWYIRQINDKLDTHSRTQTVARAHQLNLIGDSDTARVAQAEAHEPPENPYKGLRAFGEADADDFFGRERLVQRLVERLGEEGRFLAVVGPSGSGKSSVVRAGLIPALRRDAWWIAEMLPGTHPLEELEVALLRMAANPPPSLLPQLREDERGLLRAARRVLPDDQSVLALFIDQFEEAFTLVEDEAERQRFLDAIYTAVTDTRSPIRVVITLRADFYDRPLLYPNFGALMQESTEVVLPLTGEELEQAITRPATRVGATVEAGLTAAMVAEANQQPGALPLLQYALTELFDYSQGGSLTLEGYRAIGGVTGALARRVDALYEGLGAAGQETARQMFLRLVTLGEGVEDTRRRVLQAELLGIETPIPNPSPASEGRELDTHAGAGPPVDRGTTGGWGEDLMDEIIQTFAAYRLLTLDHDPATRAATVELAHEAMLREWGRLRAWLDESRADVRMQRLLAHDARAWNDAGQDRSYLLSGSRLAQFEEWAASTGLALTVDERAYVQASVTERERQAAIEGERQARETRLERRSRNFLRALVIVLVLATLGAFGLTGVAVRSEAEARSLALASAAQLALNEGNTDLAIQQAEAALQISDNALARRVLDLAAFASGTTRIFQDSQRFVPRALASTTDLTFVMISHGAAGDPFWDPVIKGMEDACTLLNASCQWSGVADGNWNRMADYWEEALALNADGIGTTNIQPDAIASGLEQAAERGIPAVVFNSVRGSESDAPLPAFLYIGSDEYVSGQTNARRVFAEARADGVSIQRGACTMPIGRYPPMVIRCAGVESVFDDEGVPFDLLPVHDSPGSDAADQIAAYFADHPDTNAIFAMGPNSTFAMNLYIQTAGLQPGQLYITTHDTAPEIFQMIRDGYLLQTIDQQPYMQGFQTIMSLYLYRQYGIRPSGFINTASVVDRSNVEYVERLVELGYR